MPNYAAPGVYVEEVASSQKVLTAAPTAVAAFVGFTEKAPTDDPRDPDGLAPRLVTSWSQFEALYGSFTASAVLPLSVYGYFANGGSIAYIVRVPNTTPSGLPATVPWHAGVPKTQVHRESSQVMSAEIRCSLFSGS